MACCLLGAQPLSEPMLVHFLFEPWEHISVQFEWKILIRENDFENIVSTMAAIVILDE